MEYQPKLNENYGPILHFTSTTESTSYKSLQDSAPSSYISYVLH